MIRRPASLFQVKSIMLIYDQESFRIAGTYRYQRNYVFFFIKIGKLFGENVACFKKTVLAGHKFHSVFIFDFHIRISYFHDGIAKCFMCTDIR